jgi:hypothetical protein
LVAAELTTDEAVVAWNDGTMDFYQTWTSLDRFVTGICSLFFSNCKLQ